MVLLILFESVKINSIKINLLFKAIMNFEYISNYSNYVVDKLYNAVSVLYKVVDSSNNEDKTNVIIGNKYRIDEHNSRINDTSFVAIDITT